MKRIVVIAILILAGAVFAAETNEYIVKTQNIPVLQAFVKEHSLTIEPLITYPNPSPQVLDYTRGTYVVSFGTLEQGVAKSLMSALKTLEGMQYVEPNSVIHIEPVEQEDVQMFNMPDTFPWPYTPNDPMYNQQWNMRITKANWAWNISTGDGVKIGIIDTGIDADHEDLEPNIDFELSYNFKADNTNINDGYGHGVLVSGIAAAKIDNNKGIAGFAGDAAICVLKATGDDGMMYIDDRIEAIYYAADKGINIINFSTGSFYNPWQPEEDAINYAWGNGVFLCAGAGNDNKNASGFYPCAYEHVMGVGGINQSDQRWVKDASMGSNYGPTVDVYAPSVDVPTTRNDGTYSTGAYGTSMATPHVAGLAALTWSVHPDWTNQDVWNKIIESSDTITIDKGKVLRINAMEALDIDSVSIAEQPTQPTFDLSDIITSNIASINYSFDASGTIQLFSINGRLVESHTVTGEGAIQIPNLSAGVYMVRFKSQGVAQTRKLIITR